MMQKFQSIPEDYKAVTGSHKAIPQSAQKDSLNPNEVIEFTLYVRRKTSIEPLLNANKRINHEEYEQQYCASVDDMQRLEEFAHKNHFAVVLRHCVRRSLILRGRIKDIERAFQVNMAQYYDSHRGRTFRCRTGSIYVPANLHDIIEGVFGLDNRPAARAMFQIAKESGDFIIPEAVSQSYTPDEVADIYHFPADMSGKDQCIGIIELGGGYRVRDIENYFKGLEIKPPAVKAISVDGAANAPSTPDSADGEVMLDIEVAGAVAPKANIVVYFTSNTAKGFLDALTTAIHDQQNNPSVISVSWGAPEKRWTQQALNSFNDAFKTASSLGVTICTAAGDGGSADNENDGKVHADFPSSSPYVLSCGGTKLLMSDDTIQSETVWNESDTSATGGGISEHFSLPDYQKEADVPASLNNNFKGRGLPDIAGNADPTTGYQVLVDGRSLVIGGTSAVAPLMAGLIARMNELKGDKLGFVNPSLYSDPSAARDIIEGNNITTSTNIGYKAGAGWDACTGWGVPSEL
jgi:kumamolisin